MTYYTLIKYKYIEKSSEKPAFFLMSADRNRQNSIAKQNLLLSI